MHRKRINQEAACCIRKRHARAFSLTVCALCTALCLSIAGYLMTMGLAGKPYAQYLNAAGQCLLLTIGIAVCGGLRQGTNAWFTAAAFGKSPSFIQPVYWLRRGRGMAAFAVLLRVFLRKFVAGLLFSLPGICICALAFYELIQGESIPIFLYAAFAGGMLCLICGMICAALFNQKYALIPLLLSINPKMHMRELVKSSTEHMEGRHLRTIGYKLSLFPWWTTCIFILPIPYVVPHCRMRMACWYADLYRQNESSADLFAHKHSRHK